MAFTWMSFLKGGLYSSHQIGSRTFMSLSNFKSFFCYSANWYRCCVNPLPQVKTKPFSSSSESRISRLGWTAFPEFFSCCEINQVFPPGHSESRNDGNQPGSFSSCFHFSGNQSARAKEPLAMTLISFSGSFEEEEKVLESQQLLARDWNFGFSCFLLSVCNAYYV